MDPGAVLLIYDVIDHVIDGLQLKKKPNYERTTFF